MKYNYSHLITGVVMIALIVGFVGLMALIIWAEK